MATPQRTMLAWVRRRTRNFENAFGTPRAKAVRYAAEDWRALQGGRRTCEDLGVCQRHALRVVKGAAEQDCAEPGQCIKRMPAVQSPKAMQDFRRFLGRATGAQA